MLNLVAAALWALAGTAIPTAQAQTTEPTLLQFRVDDDGEPAGILEVRIEQEGAVLRVRRQQELNLRRGWVRVKLLQSSEERWQGKRFVSLDSNTEAKTSLGDRRKTLRVRRKGTDGLDAVFNDKPILLPPSAVPLPWWDRQRLRGGKVFDLGSGEVTMATAPRRAVASDGVMRQAGLACEAYAIDLEATRKTEVLLWFDADGLPCGFRLTADGDVLTYTRISSGTNPGRP